MITVHFNHAKRHLDILKLLSMSDGRIERRINKLNEQKNGTILSLKQLLKKIGDKTFE